jgi:hypothetical protein
MIALFIAAAVLLIAQGSELRFPTALGQRWRLTLCVGDGDQLCRHRRSARTIALQPMAFSTVSRQDDG